jgi:hypothetical protein
VVRVQTDHRARGGRGGSPERRPRHPLTRSLAAHLAWSALVLGTAAVAIGLELAAPCPPGGPLALGDCDDVRPFAIGVVGLSAGLYVVGLSAVRWWTGGLRRRGVADRRAARDWYLLAAGIGLLVCPLLAFTLVSGLR